MQLEHLTSPDRSGTSWNSCGGVLWPVRNGHPRTIPPCSSLPALLCDSAVLAYRSAARPSKWPGPLCFKPCFDPCISKNFWMMMILLFCFNRGKGFDWKTFKAWVLKMKAPALPSSLLLYNSLLARGFKIFLLTGRDESLRNGTVHNLFQAGYKGWAGLILRGKSDQGTSAGVYKPKKRGELVKKGYHLWGSVGDQWNDLIGPYQASRSFKLPNPMYYVS